MKLKLLRAIRRLRRLEQKLDEINAARAKLTRQRGGACPLCMAVALGNQPSQDDAVLAAAAAAPDQRVLHDGVGAAPGPGAAPHVAVPRVPGAVRLHMLRMLAKRPIENVLDGAVQGSGLKLEAEPSLQQGPRAQSGHAQPRRQGKL